MIRACVSLTFLALLATSCSTPQAARQVRFHEQEQANLVVRYYTDDTSYVLKPVATEGPFLAVLNKDAVLDVARQQPSRQLAVVILIHYGADSETEAVKSKWSNLLTGIGYQRVVFLHASRGLQIEGLPILANGG
jgi:hypothetical protein